MNNQLDNNNQMNGANIDPSITEPPVQGGGFQLIIEDPDDPSTNEPEEMVQESTPVATEQPVQPTVMQQSQPLTNSVVSSTVQPPSTSVSESQPKVQTPQVVNQTQTSESTNVTSASTVEEIPCASGEVVVISNEKKVKKSNILPTLVIVGLVILTLLNIDKIIDIFKDGSSVNAPTGDKNIEPNNTVDGFVLINDNSSNIKVDTAKFYNFKKVENTLNITFNCTSSKVIKNVESLKIYIEFYNSEKELLYKEWFKPDTSIYDVKLYSITLNSDVYSDAYYANAKIYTEEENNRETSIKCIYRDKEATHNVVYNYTYNFKNNSLESYNVDKELFISIENTETNRAKDKLKEERDKMTGYGIEVKYEDTKINYTIDYTKEMNELPIYEKGVTPTIVKKKETLKKWECE